MRAACLVPILSLALAAPAVAQTGTLSPAAPPDRPVAVASDTARANLFARMEPFVARARASYPDAKRRFLAGLPAGQSLFVTTRLRDARGRVEQVFVAVESIDGAIIRGHLASQIGVVEGYHEGDAYSLPESELVDWLISRPDGSEEGNFIGKFLDEEQRRG